MIDIDKCLQRIAYQGSHAPTLETLAALQLAFVYNVPFENLDVHLGREIRLDVDRFYNKIVEQRRGGFCYECNTLFHAMLAALGFDVRYVAATMQLEIAMNIEFEHMALLVSLDGEYLVDVGNGQSCLQPMLAGSDHVASWEGIDYRLGEFEDRHALYFRTVDDEWRPRFSFTTTTRQLPEFAKLCDLIQHSPASHFTHKRVVTLAIPGGRIVLADRQLDINRDGRLETLTLGSSEEYREALATYFNIGLADMPADW